MSGPAGPEPGAAGDRGSVPESLHPDAGVPGPPPGPTGTCTGTLASAVDVPRRGIGGPATGAGEAQRVAPWATQWLASAADDPWKCLAVWRNDPSRPFLLATGRLFDVVVVEQRVGMEALDQMCRRRLPLGPVVADWCGEQLGFFLPKRSHEQFVRRVQADTQTALTYKYLGAGSYVVVPGPMALSRSRYTWLSAPARKPPEPAPARAVALAATLLHSATLIERLNRYGEQAPAAGPETAGNGVTECEDAGQRGPSRQGDVTGQHGETPGTLQPEPQPQPEPTPDPHSRSTHPGFGPGARLSQFPGPRPQPRHPQRQTGAENPQRPGSGHLGDSA